MIGKKMGDRRSRRIEGTAECAESSRTRIARIFTKGILKQEGNRENGVMAERWVAEKWGLREKTERTEFWQKNDWQKNG
jgi:hypothetical protein